MGWLDKLQDGAKFEGTTNKGRNYSPAWGGQFQSGGNMNYYKAGTDFQPKSISQDGTYVPKPNIKAALKQLPAIKKYAKENKITESEASQRIYNTKKHQESNQIRKYVPQKEVDRQLEQMANPMTTLGYMARGQEIPDYLARHPRNPLDYATDIINPGGIVKGLADIPNDVSEGNYGTAALNALSALPMAHELAPTAKRVLSPATELISDLSKAKSTREALGRTFRGIPVEASIPRLGAQDLKAMRQAQEIGRLRDLGKTHEELLQHALDQGIPDEHLQKMFGMNKARMQEVLSAPSSESAHGTINLQRPAYDYEGNPVRRGSGATPLTPEQITDLRGQYPNNPLLRDIDERRSVRAQGSDLDVATAPEPEMEDLNWDAESRQHRLNTIADVRRDFPDLRADPDFMRNLLGEEGFAAARERQVDPTLRGRVSVSDLSHEQVRDLHQHMLERSIPLRDAREAERRAAIQAQINQPSQFSWDDYAETSGALNPPPMTLRGKIGDTGEMARSLSADVQRGFRERKEGLLDKYTQAYPRHKGHVRQEVPLLTLSGERNLKNVSDKVENAAQASEYMSPGDVYTGSLNTSHSSYLPQMKQVFKQAEGEPQFLGYHPMNEMGYLSRGQYTPDEIASYINTELDTQVKRGIIPKDIQRPYAKGEQVILPHYGVKKTAPATRERPKGGYKELQKGGIIEDEMGQWNHPGKVTRIPSNRITMKGVDYPVLGVSDTGDKKLMQPGGEYKFKGKSVTEYPKGKNGKELTKLDQLTNFTNYNTKQPGGWLDKL